jgi:hypothetical protein
VVENTVNLTQNESLLVIIEEDYSQGKKEVTVELYNQSKLEDSIIEIFTIKQIGINEFQVMHQEDKRLPMLREMPLRTISIPPTALCWQAV